jgi:hypothetical protein
MPEGTLPALAGWESFYVIVGSSGAALIGLQFVVIVLITEVRQKASPETIGAFGTPTVVHFGSALLVSAVMSAPWTTLASIRIVLGLGGLAGIALVARAFRRARRQSGYTPVWEDWLWHMILPFVAYTVLLVAALFLPVHPPGAMFGIGAVALTLLFIGIHNAWDTVTYIALGAASEKHDEPE